MAVLKWSGVALEIQSALATSVAITGITKADPAVVSHSGTDPTDGDIVLLKTNGMNDLNERLFRVANAASGTFELEDEDSTNYDSFASGTFEVVTFGHSVSSITAVNPSGGEPEYTDITTIHDLTRKQTPTVKTPIEFAMTSLYQPSDAALKALNAADKIQGALAGRFTFRDGTTVYFYGFVAFAFVPGGQAQGVVETPLSFAVTGFPTYYTA